MKPSMDQVIQRRDALTGVLENANYHYYTKNQPIMSDHDYDMYMQELIKLETEYPKLKLKDSPTQRVGAINFADSKFKTVKHNHPMLSLENVFDVDKVVKFVEGNLPIFAELKYDGASLSIHYKDGRLVKAVSRGNGKAGEDITDNVFKKVKGVPNTIPEKKQIEFRGEVVMDKADFAIINAERIAAGLEPYSNCRNAASGMLRNKDSKEVRGINFKAYIIPAPIAMELGIHSQEQAINYMRNMGFEAGVESKLCNNVQDVLDHIDWWGKNKDTLPFDIDGLVLKVNSFARQLELGTASKYPKWAAAFKYPSDEATTKMYDVTYQVGKLGTITPVAELEPVEINGSVITRATLHNFDQIALLDLRKNDLVFVTKAAEVVPKVVKPVKELRTGDEEIIERPTVCPVCGTPVIQIPGEVAIKCPNFECAGRMKGLIRAFVGKKGLDIEGFGESNVELFYEQGLVKTPMDIFDLQSKQAELKALPKFGEKKVSNLIKAIDMTRGIEPARAIYALQIETVGESVSELLINHYGHFDEVLKATKEELASIPGVGEVCAESIVKTRETEFFKKLYDKMRFFGIKFLIKKEDAKLIPQGGNNEVVGKTFCITGTLQSGTRSEVQAKIKAAGGIVKDSVTKALDYLVVGEEAGSKMEKAIEYGITVLTEQELFKLIK